MKLIIITILLFLSNSMFSQDLDDFFVETNGTVYDIDSDSNYIYFAGDFTNVMHYTGSGVIFSKDNIEIDFNNKFKITGEVIVAKPDGNGGWYVGGKFTKIGNQYVSKFAHIFSDGSLDTIILPFIDFEFVDFTFDDEHIYIPNSSRIIKINIKTGETTTLIINRTGYYITYLQVHNDYIYATGGYQYHKDNFNYGGRYSKLTGEKDDDFSFSYSEIIKIYENNLYYISDKIILRRINLENNEKDDNWKVEVSGNPREIHDIAFDTDYIYIAGSFNSINEVPMQNLARIDLTTNEIDKEWINHSIGTISKFDLDNDFLYLVGLNKDEIYKINKSNGELIDSIGFNTYFDNDYGRKTKSINTLSLSNNKILLGGSYSSIGNAVAANNIFRYEIKENKINTDIKIKLENNYNNINSIYRIKLIDNYLYLIGGFNKINDLEIERVAKYDLAKLKLVETWKPFSIESFITSIEFDDNYVYFGGDFVLENNIKNLVRYKISNDEIDLSWKPNPNRVVNALKLEKNNLFVGGTFDTIYNSVIPYFAKLDIKYSKLDKDFDLGFVYDPNFKSNDGSKQGVSIIEVNDNYIFLTASLKSKQDVNINGFAKISKDDYKITNLNDTVKYLNVSNVAFYKNKLFCNNFKVDLDEFKIDDTWNIKFNITQNLTLKVVNDHIYYGGGFSPAFGYMSNKTIYRNSLVKVNLIEEKINTPKLISPPNNSYNVPLYTKLECSNIENIIDYEFWFSYDSDFKEYRYQSYEGLDYNPIKNHFLIWNLEPSSKVYWKARAINEFNKSDWSEVYSFYTRFKGPLFINTDYKTYNNNIEYKFLNVEWEDFGDNFVYYLIASEDKDFKKRFIDSVLVEENKYSANNFKDSSIYFLRVYALENDKISDYYSTLKINTLFKKVPEKIKLVVPKNDSIEVSAKSMYFIWNYTRDSEINNLQLSKDPLFKSFIINDDSIKVQATDNVNTKYYELKNLDSNTTYYWRVKAKNKLGESEFSDTWKFTTMSSTSNVEDSKDNLISIYPNPANSILNIESNNQYINIDKIEILDLNGKSFLKQDVFKSKIDLDIRFLPTGAYLIKIESQNENKTFKFIKN